MSSFASKAQTVVYLRISQCRAQDLQTNAKLPPADKQPSATLHAEDDMDSSSSQTPIPRGSMSSYTVLGILNGAKNV
jgi:hypothetical protein